MKRFEVTVRLKGEGYATRVVRVEAHNPKTAQAIAYLEYLKLIEVEEPVELSN